MSDPDKIYQTGPVLIYYENGSLFSNAEKKEGELMPEQTAQTEIIKTLSDIADIDAIGKLSPECNTAVSFAGGKKLKQYLDGSVLYELELRIWGKNIDQLAAADSVFGICSLLSEADVKKLPEIHGCKLRFIRISSMPSLEKRQDDGIWIYSGAISVIYLNKALP